MHTGENKLIVAAAGSGKTTYLVEEALQHPNDALLITTYTEANEAEIRKKFIAICGCVPSHVRIQTWFSFLIQHGVKPFQSGILEADIGGLLLVNTMSARGVPERTPERYYLSPDRRIYSDKLAKLVIRCNERCEGKVFDRMSRVFSQIFIDEVQDLAGYDLCVLKELFASRVRMLLVGDPRQVTYLTHNERKFEKYADGKICEFVAAECRGLHVHVDDTTLSCSHRSHRLICELSDQLYPAMRSTASTQSVVTHHDGVFLVQKKQVGSYLSQFQPTQLRADRRVQVDSTFPVYNFGESKGLGFDRVLIYPTKDMLGWIFNRQAKLATMTRAKFYVALTRARYSVALVWDGKGEPLEEVSRWP